MNKLPDKVRDYFVKQGSIGGKKGSAMLSPEERREKARKAVETRWNNRKQLNARKDVI